MKWSQSWSFLLKIQLGFITGSFSAEVISKIAVNKLIYVLDVAAYCRQISQDPGGAQPCSQGLSSLAPGDGWTRDPGNEVVFSYQLKELSHGILGCFGYEQNRAVFTWVS